METQVLVFFREINCLFNIFSGRKEVDLLSRQLSETSVKNDTLDISASCSTSSTPKKANSESGVETGSNDTASVASSGSRHSLSSGIASRDEDVFEVPRTIRFPPAAPTKCYSEVVICKWELCGNEFDSTGKLLDHLKVNNISFLAVKCLPFKKKKKKKK